MIHMLMNNSHTFRSFLAASMMAAAVSVSPALAQEDIGTMVNNGLNAMNAEKWEEALKIHTDIVAQHGKNNPLQIFGPQFGNIYYRKGMCELRLKKFDEALKSFEIVAKNFPNNAKPGGGNQFEKMAILRIAEAQMGLEQWQEAIANFDKFLKERDKTKDKYNEGIFHLSLAICYYKLEDLIKGNENLETAIRNKEKFKTSSTGIIAAFQAMVEAAIAKKNEAAIIDFIAKNRADLMVRPFLMQDFTRVFMRLAAQAIGAEMYRAAMALYHFVPGTDITIEDLRIRLNAMGNLRGLRDGQNTLIREKLEADLKRVEESRRGKRAPEMVKLGAMAFIHEKHGNVRGAFAAYQQLEYYYPASEKREDNLFNLVRTSALISRGAITQKYGELFLKNFPNSKYAPDVKKMMLSSLFYDGEYELCIEVAEPMLPNLTPDTVEHDTCLHVLGGSYFYTGQYDKAQPLLDQHVEKYPKSAFDVSALYFQASNTSRLQFWAKAGTLLDAFLAKYPNPGENIFFPFALYDRANCHFAEEKYEEALVNLNRIISEFPESDVIDQTWNLRGNVEQSTGEREEAEKSYLKALEIAERRQNFFIAAESLYSLVALLGDKSKGEERLKDAVPYADRYWKDYSNGSPYNAKVAVAQVAALVAVNRDEEALERLQKVIIELARNPEARGLEELINSYTEAYLVKHSPEELKEHYYNFPEIRAADRAARALLRVAVIGVFEGVAKKTDDNDRKRSAEAMITVLFRELKSDFELKDLTNYILVRVGDFLRTSTSTPREALPYYDEVLGRQDQSYRFNALLGRADVYGLSTNPADIEKAIEDFNRIFADSQEKAQREFSLFRMVELHMAKRDFAKAADLARIYLDREKNGFAKFSPKVGLMLAQSFDERNMVEDAIAMYVKIWSVHMGNITVSAPAITRWMELLWSRNKPGDGVSNPADRQAAYEKGAGFIELTSRFKEKLTPEELELWKGVEKLVLTYESSAGIKTMEQIRKEKEKGGR
jgi:tetratricopeptide (TPR) repeat protein